MDLEYDGLTLRPPTVDDADVVVGAVHSSLAELTPWMPWASAAYDTNDALAWIRGDLGDAHRFVMMVDGEMVGSCGLNKVDVLNGAANLGYWVRSDRAGRGHATAATKLVARFGLEQAGYHRLEVVMSTRNEASRRVAERAGATHEGILRSALALQGERHDAHVWSFVRADLG